MNFPSRLACACGAAVLFAVSAFADATDEVKAALQDFLDQPNYTWDVSSTRGKPEEASPGGEQEVDGQHEKGGYTKINFVRGRHILPRGTLAREPWVGFNDEEKLVSSRWVFATSEGWKLLSNLPNPDMPRVGPPAARSGGISIPIVSIGFSTRSFGPWRPDQEIEIVLSNLANVEQASSGVYQAELTPDGASKLINPQRTGLTALMIGVRNPSSTLKLWVRDGSLVRYELSVEGTMTFPGGEHAISYSRTRELSHFGTTVIEVPDEVRHKLGR